MSASKAAKSPKPKAKPAAARRSAAPPAPSAAAPSRNERRKLETRTRLIDAALRVMGAKGIEATTIRDITDAADVGFGSFYNYFETKEQLVEQAVSETLTQFGEQIDAFNAQHEDPLEIMAAGIGNFVRMARVDPVLSQFLVRVGFLDPALGRNISGRMARDLRRGIDQGRFTVPDVDTARAMVAGALFGFMRERLVGRLDPETDVAAVHLILRLMGTREDEAARLARNFKRIPLNEKKGD